MQPQLGDAAAAVPHAAGAMSLEQKAFMEGPVDAGAMFGNPTVKKSRRGHAEAPSRGGGGGPGRLGSPGRAASGKPRKHDMSPRQRGLEIVDATVLSTLEDLVDRCEATGLVGLSGQ